jgi:hypothetical protein
VDSAVSLAPLAWLAPRDRMDSQDLRQPVSPEPRERRVSPEAREQKEPPAYRVRHPAAPQKQKV